MKGLMEMIKQKKSMWNLSWKKCTLMVMSFILVIGLSGCGKSDDVKDFSKLCDVDMTGGEVISSEDTHGGFLGDGYTLIKIEYPDDSVVSEIKESEHWHELPLSESLNTFVYQPCDDNINIPEITNGYYFFYDRHSEADDRYSDAELYERHSFNFTFAIYDSDSDTVYICKYDT
ncbi:MAG: hypothetical protein ACI4EW_07905 [Butyrivibrio sp.]